MDSPPLPTGFIDLFAGAGGMTWGWRQAGFSPLAAIDNDGAAIETHAANFGRGCQSLKMDLRKLRPRQLEGYLGPRQKVFAIVGGPPCQGWSRAGRGKLRSLNSKPMRIADDPRNGLFKRFVAFTRHFRPEVLVMENVPGMLRLEGVEVAEQIATEFVRIGYKIGYALVNAQWFGVPQSRWRLIFIGHRNELDVDLDPEDLEVYGKLFRARTLGLRHGTVLRQALADLPSIRAGTRTDPQPYGGRPGRRSAYQELMRRDADAFVHDHICRSHNDMDLEAFRRMKQGGLYADLPPHLQRYRTDIFPDKYRRLKWNDVSGTITAHLAKDCYQHIHPLQHRTISIREAARVQSFPDNFRFHGNMGDRFRMIGNAVPPFMAWGIAEFVRTRCRRAGILRMT